MKKYALALVLALVPTAAAFAQKPATEKPAAEKANADRPVAAAPAPRDTIRVGSMGELVPTPEMWFYEQERRRGDDPQLIVRANAQQRAADRHARIASLAWYGLSNSRPSVSPDPVQGDFAPRWTSGNYMPMRWNGGGPGPTIILQADRGVGRY